MATNLSPAELLKYDWRIDIFIKKLMEGSEFELVAGKKKVKLIHNKQHVTILQKRDRSQLMQLRLADTKGNVYKLSDLSKSAEFGGKGEGAGVHIEVGEIKSINKQLDKIKSSLGSATVPIVIDGKVYNVAACHKTDGTPKSDFHLVDLQGKEVVWISHKKGSKATDFQQWGGMSPQEANVYNHPESRAFIEAVRKKYGKTGLPPTTVVGRAIKDKRLIGMAVYGVDYGKALGRQNVTLLVQGPVIIKATGYPAMKYEITANHVHENGEMPTGDFTPVFLAIHRGDRSNFGIPKSRFAIYPVKGRKATEII